MRKRGRFGRKSSAALRSLYPIVLGLGGWFFGVLIVITTMPGVPIDDELLAVLSVGTPIGLGIYCAWVDRDRSARTRTAGLVAATSGALIGAWLGFNATADLLALVISIVGASVGANLILLVLDIARTGRLAISPRQLPAVSRKHPCVSKRSVVFFTNYPWHWAGDQPATQVSSVVVAPKYTAHPLPDEQGEVLTEALSQYGDVPGGA